MTAEKLYYRRLPPTVSGTTQVVQATTGAAAASFDWVTALGSDAPNGKCWIRVEGLTNTAYVRFGSSATTGTTATNGWHVGTGAAEECFWYVDPVAHRYIDHIAPGGAGTLKLQVCSPIGERRDI